MTLGETDLLIEALEDALSLLEQSTDDDPMVAARIIQGYCALAPFVDSTPEKLAKHGAIGSMPRASDVFDSEGDEIVHEWVWAKAVLRGLKEIGLGTVSVIVLESNDQGSVEVVFGPGRPSVFASFYHEGSRSHLDAIALIITSCLRYHGITVVDEWPEEA